MALQDPGSAGKPHPAPTPSAARRGANTPSHGDFALGKVSAVVAVSNLQLRQILRSTLAQQGVGQVRDVAHIDDLKDSILNERPDLVLCDNDLNGGQISRLITDLRHGDFSDNPFPIITSLTGTPVADRVKTLVNAGVDDVVSLPVAPRTVVTRALGMIDQRRPFVVTSDYTGPDRRSAARQKETPPGFLLEVPNTLRMKALGTYDSDVVLDQIQAMRDTINLRKVERHADRIVYGANLVLPVLRDGHATDAARLQIRQMGDLAQAIGARIAGTRYAHVSDLCSTLHDVTDRLDATEVNLKDVQLFEQLVAAVDRSFNTSDDAQETAAARSITSTLRDSSVAGGD